MSDKLYLSAQQLLEDSFELGAQIIRDGFRPTIIIAIWRGGTPMGIAVQELLAWFGIETDHIAIRTSSYQGIDGRSNEIRIHGMNYLIKNCRQQDRLLIVDDVFDTGLTIQAVIAYLTDRACCLRDDRLWSMHAASSVLARVATGRRLDSYRGGFRRGT